MPSDEKRPLGRILLQRKLVPRELQGALREQKPADAPVSSSVRPVVPEPVVPEKDAEHEELLALSERTGVPGLDLRQVNITLEHLDVMPREVAEALRILPVLLGEGLVYLAMVDPQDKKTLDEVEFVTGKTVHPFVVPSATLLRTIAAAYDAKARGEATFTLSGKTKR
jgi:hypothetical protein